MNAKYVVCLTEEEREYLKRLIREGKTQGYRICHAQILLKLDENSHGKKLSQTEIGEMYGRKRLAVSEISRRFVEKGLESALGRKKQENRHRKIYGDVEAKIVSIACTNAPEGRERWTLQLIADELVRLEVIESISSTAVGTTLKKMNLSLGG